MAAKFAKWKGFWLCSVMRMKTLIGSLALTLSLSVLASSAESAEIMPFQQVKKGMTGYGLTVFEGSKVEKFDVKILGVLNNIGPGQNLILAHVSSDVIKASGVIAGMSGSPIYIDGRIIGALAYSWQFAKDSVAGITPIEEMLLLDKNGSGSSRGASQMVAPRFNAQEIVKVLVGRDLNSAFETMMTGFAPNRGAGASGAMRIATPLSMGGFSSETVSRYGKMLEAGGFLPVPAGSTGGGQKVSTNAKPFEPGGAMAGILLTGDFTMAATGTVTHIDGDLIYGFGHPFLDMGEIDFPLATSEIVTVMPSLASSFKFANSGDIVGALKQDRSAGVLGVIGKESELIPVEMVLDGSRGSQTYHFRVVRHPQLSPLMIAMVTDSVVANAQRAAGERTVLLDSEIDVEGFPTIKLKEGWAGPDARQAIPSYLAIVSSYLMSNEFHDANIKRVKIHLRHDDSLKVAKIIEASVETPADGEFNPGDTVKVRTLLKPYRGESFVETFEIRVPDSQAAGNAYIFVGSGSAVNQLDFAMVPPDPRTLDQVVGVIERLRSSTDLTLGFYSTSEGRVTSGVYLPNLPPSIGKIVDSDSSNAARAAVGYYAPNHVVRPLDYIIDGAMKIDLQIKPKV